MSFVLNRILFEATRLDEVRDVNYYTNIGQQFLVACTRLYKSLCRSVGWSIGKSITHVLCERFSHMTGALVYTAPPTTPAPHITAPAQLHATDAVATTLFHGSLIN